MINIVVTLKIASTEDYLKAFAVMYLSMKASTKHPLNVYILHDRTLSREQMDLLSSIVYTGDAFQFIDVTKSEIYNHITNFSEIVYTGYYTDAILWRVFLPELLPNVQRLILCDVDLIFLFDISRVWELALPAGHCIASVFRKKIDSEEYLRAVNTRPGKYFRLGLSLIDMAVVKKHSQFMNERFAFLENRLPEINKIRIVA